MTERHGDWTGSLRELVGEPPGCTPLPPRPLCLRELPGPGLTPHSQVTSRAVMAIGFAGKWEEDGPLWGLSQVYVSGQCLAWPFV